MSKAAIHRNLVLGPVLALCAAPVLTAQQGDDPPPKAAPAAQLWQLELGGIGG